MCVPAKFCSPNILTLENEFATCTNSLATSLHQYFICVHMHAPATVPQRNYILVEGLFCVLQHVNSLCQEQAKRMTEEQTKKMEEQAKRMEEQTKGMTEQLSGEVASLKEALEKLITQMATK